MTRGEVVAKHLPAIAAAIVDTGAKPRPDWLLADELRLHAEELLSAANLIDRPWLEPARDLIARLRMGETIAMGDLASALEGWPCLGNAGSPEMLKALLNDTGRKGRAAAESLLMEAVTCD